MTVPAILLFSPVYDKSMPGFYEPKNKTGFVLSGAKENGRQAID